jgi:hypothetical protein
MSGPLIFIAACAGNRIRRASEQLGRLTLAGRLVVYSDEVALRILLRA